jgi:hypothetical protein
MSLDKDTEDKVLAHLKKVWGDGVCRECGKGPQQIQGYVPLALSESPAASMFGGGVLPCIAIVCTVCGSTKLVNLIVAGAIEGPPKNG